MAVDVDRTPREVVYASRYASLDLALAAAAGKRLILEGKTYTGLSNLAPASFTSVEGAGDGKTVLLAPASPTAPVFDLNGVEGVSLGGFGLEPLSGTATSAGHGIRVRGSCDNLLFEDITAEGFVTPFHFSGSHDATLTGNNAVQIVRIGGSPTGGTITLAMYPPTGGALQTTGAIAYDASAGTVQTALEALALFAPGDVTVTGSAPAWTITLGGAFAGLWVPLFRANTSLTGGTTPTVSVEESTRGGGPWITNVTLRNLTGINSPSSFGFWLDDVDDFAAYDCRAIGNYLDGFKGRKAVRNLKLIGGDYSRNGRGYYATGTPTGGDGIDTYAGGEKSVFQGVTTNDNFGNGMQIKNDEGALSGYGSGKYGISRKLDIIGHQASRNQGGSGLAIIEAGSPAVDSYSVSLLSVIGGQFEANVAYGIEVTGRLFSIIGAKTIRNYLRGIYVHANASDGDIDGCISLANGTAAGTGVGLYIAGDRIRVRGGIYRGVYDDGMLDSTDLSTLTKYHGSNIFIVAGADDVQIDASVQHGFNNSGESIQTTATTEDIRIHQRGTLTPNSGTIYGGVGSTYEKTNAATTAGRWWRKASGNANAASGWERVLSFPTSSAYTPTNVTTDRAYDADTVVVAELADIVGTLIADLKTAGVLS